MSFAVDRLKRALGSCLFVLMLGSGFGYAAPQTKITLKGFQDTTKSMKAEWSSVFGEAFGGTAIEHCEVVSQINGELARYRDLNHSATDGEAYMPILLQRRIQAAISHNPKLMAAAKQQGVEVQELEVDLPKSSNKRSGEVKTVFFEMADKTPTQVVATTYGNCVALEERLESYRTKH